MTSEKEKNRVLRIAALAFLLALSTDVAHAVIPGIAPGLVAILPQLIILLVTALALLVSPRAWWRGARWVMRHPLRSGATVACLLLAFIAARALAGMWPGSLPGAPIAETAAGLPLGDLRASRIFLDSGPRSVPQRRDVTLPGSLRGSAPWRLVKHASLGGRVLVRDRSGLHLALLDPEAGAVIWQSAFRDPIALDPIAFERRIETETGTGAVRRERGVLLVTSAGGSGRGGAVLLLHGDTGNTVARAALRSSPQAAALVDDRLVVAVDGGVVGLEVRRAALRDAWTAARPPLAAVDLAGDEQGRFFLLDEEGLLEGDLEDGALREVLRLAPATPLAMAVRSGRIFVLQRTSKARARVIAIDPSRGGPKDRDGETPGIVWSAPLGDLALATLAAGPPGVTLALRDSLALLDPRTGAILQRLALDAPPVALAVGKYSPYLVLEHGDVLRYSPSLESVEWRVSAPEPSAPAGRSGPSPLDLVVTGERLVVARGGRFHVFTESAAEGGAAWSHWRGGPGRSGAPGEARAPLDGRLLWIREPAPWRWPLPPPSGSRERTFESADVLPFEEESLFLVSATGEVELRDENGERVWGEPAPGHPRGAVRSGRRVFIGRTAGSDGRLISFRIEDRGEGVSGLRTLWGVPLPPIPRGDALAVTGDVIAVALRSSVRAVSAHDGRRLWERAPVEAPSSPLIAGGLLVVTGEDGTGDGGRIAALDLGTGKTSWVTERAGSRLGPPSLHEGLVIVGATGEGGTRLLALEPAGGSVVRERELDLEAITGPVAAGAGSLVVRDPSGRTLVLGPDGAALARREPADGASPVAPIVAFGLIVIAEGTTVRALDSLGLEPLWEASLPAPVEALVLDEGRVLGVTRKHLFALGAE